MLWRARGTRLKPIGFVEPCIPTVAKVPPAGPSWVHEIKHDGYRLMVRKIERRVRVFTRRGIDWSHRFPRIVEAAQALPVRTAHIDGEGVVCDSNGVADFAKLHSGAYDEGVFLYAFDLLEVDGVDLRREPLAERKTQLARLVATTKYGMAYSEHTEQDGAAVYKHACAMGLEGIVCKRLDHPYRSGKSAAWLKVKNPNSPARLRGQDGSR